jgi:glycine/D-amino acid oxidase-like deaminating enzyme
MGEGCRLLQGADIPAPLRSKDLLAALHSPPELRVESREAIPRFAQWLEQSLGVSFFWRTAVHGIASGEVASTQGLFFAPRIVVCPGPDISTLFPDIFARRQVTLCKLHMLRLADPGWRLPAGSFPAGLWPCLLDHQPARPVKAGPPRFKAWGLVLPAGRSPFPAGRNH